MKKKCLIPFIKLIGIMLSCIGVGMILVLIIPFWDFIIAFSLFLSGLCLIFFTK